MQNLWAEYNNQQIASESRPRAEKQEPSRPTEQAVLSSLRAWLLADYVAPYCRSLAATRIFRRCFLIDALGGTRKAGKDVGTRFIASTSTDSYGRDASSAQYAPSIFDDLTETGQDTPSHEKHGKGNPGGRPPNPGDPGGRPPKTIAHSLSIPPILQPVVSLAQELASENKPITLQGIILEGGRGKAKTAENPFSLPKESALVNVHWRETAPALLPAIEQFAAIFLLNPIPASPSQQREIPFFTHDDLAPFYQRTAPTELCLLIAHKQIEDRLLPSLRTPPGAAAFTSLLRSDRWKTLLVKNDDIAQATDIVIDLFQAAMRQHFLAVQRIAFPMLLGPANVVDTPYTLLFATRRQDSLVCMNDAVCSYRRRLEEQSHRGLLNEAWFREQQQARLSAALQNLSEDTLRRGRASAPRRWPDLRQQLLIAHFGQWLRRDHDQVILNLLQAGDVRCDWKQPGVAANSNIVGPPLAGALSRVPGNEDTLLWKEKKRRY